MNEQIYAHIPQDNLTNAQLYVKLLLLDVLYLLSLKRKLFLFHTTSHSHYVCTVYLVGYKLCLELPYFAGHVSF